MTTSVPLPVEPALLQGDVAYLLLGDLRQLLEEPADPVTPRWLVAVLDCLLANRVRLDGLPSVRRFATLTGTERDTIDLQFYTNLQRLRDRIAHRKPHALLANEIRCDLCELLDDA
jgi:hypothetical protein